MLQDILPKKLDNHYSADIKPGMDSVIFHFKENDVLVSENRTSPFPLYSFFSAEHMVYLFSIENVHYFLARDREVAIPDGYS